MAIPYSVDTLDTIEEAYRPLYTADASGKFILTGVEGVKPLTEFNTVHGALTKERNDHKATKQTYAPLAGMEITDVLAKLDNYPTLEAAAAGKLDETAIETVVQKRLASTTAPLTRDLQATKQTLAEYQQRVEQYEGQSRTRKVHDEVRAAIAKSSGFQQSAVEDVLMLAERTFEVADDGRVQVKEGAGTTVGVDAVVWLTEMQNRRPHWWGPTQGGGSRGASGGVGSANPFVKGPNFNMTAQGALYRENPQRYEQMRQAAEIINAAAEK